MLRACEAKSCQKIFLMLHDREAKLLEIGFATKFHFIMLSLSLITFFFGLFSVASIDGNFFNIDFNGKKFKVHRRN